jgi:hypothetical protein
MVPELAANAPVELVVNSTVYVDAVVGLKGLAAKNGFKTDVAALAAGAIPANEATAMATALKVTRRIHFPRTFIPP